MNRPRTRAVLFGLVAIAALSPHAWCDDWPTYRHDIRRSGITAEALEPPLSIEWTHVPTHPPSHAWSDPQAKRVEGVLELPRLRFDDAFHVAAVGDAVYFGSSGDHQVHALDAATGRQRWTFCTAGPVRLAPTVRKGKVYFGSDDGKAYCLDARDGRLIWSRAAGPSREMVLGNGKMSSLWPLRAGVLVADGVAYFAAGVFPGEGLILSAVDAETGKALWRNDSLGMGGRANLTMQGYMLASSARLFVPSGRNVPAGFSRTDGRMLFSRNFGWRTVGLFGGTYGVLADDLLFGGTEQIGAVYEQNGYLALTECLPARTPSKGTRRLLVEKSTIYLLTGEKLLAADRAGYLASRKLITSLTLRLSKLGRDRGRRGRRLAAAKKERDKLTKADRNAKIPDELAKRIASLEAQIKDIEKQIREAKAERSGAVKRRDEPITWQADCACTDALILAGETLYAGGDGVVRAFEKASGKEAWSGKVTGRARGLAVAGGRLLVSTDTGRIHCFVRGEQGAGRKVAPAVRADPFGQDARAAAAKQLAQRFPADSGVRRGYALILGGDAGRLALELARRTELVIHVAEPDAEKVAAARKALTAAGLYGARVSVMQTPLDALPYADYFANLIVCGESFQSGRIPTPAGELLRMLKPCGGVAYVAGKPASSNWPKADKTLSPWLEALGKRIGELGESGTKVTMHSPVRRVTPDGDHDEPGKDLSTRRPWAKVVRGPLTGAGSWTHQYGEPGNTACSDDRLVRGSLGVLWYGQPGPGRAPNRHASGASPLGIGGRMFVQGENLVEAYDAYNGLRLWKREITGAIRVGLKGGVSNLAADANGLFVAVGDRCLRLDPATGETVSTYRVPPDAKGKRGNWGYVAVVGELLYGSRGRDWLFALDLATGETRWSRAAGNVAPITLAIGDGRVYFVDRSATAAQRAEALKGIKPAERVDRRGKPVPPDVRLVVALDALTGRQNWARPLYVADCVKIGRSGGELTVMYKDNVLLLCGQPWNGHFWQEFCAGEFSRRSLIALSGYDGRLLWSGRKGYRSRPLIVGGRIIAEPWAHDLKTGAAIARAHPVTGAEAIWQMARPGHHCGNIAAAPQALFFRSGVTAYYDLAGDYGTAHFGAQRPGCWINCIPANGLVLMPEASSGCICAFPLHCTTVLKPRKANRLWGEFSAPGAMLPVQRLAINFAAPGDRRDGQGRLWLAYPRPRSYEKDYDQRLVADLRMDLDDAAGGIKYVRGNPDFHKTRRAETPWVYAYALANVKRCTIPLRTKADGRGQYTVRLHFAEPTHSKPGERVFNVALQDRQVLEAFDIVKAAGGANTAVVKEFKGVRITDKLVVTLRAVKGRSLLCGIEAVAEPPAGGK